MRVSREKQEIMACNVRVSAKHLLLLGVTLLFCLTEVAHCALSYSLMATARYLGQDSEFIYVKITFTEPMNFSAIPNLNTSLATEIQKVEYPRDYSQEVVELDDLNLLLKMKFNIEIYKKTMQIMFMNPLEIVNKNGNQFLNINYYRIQTQIGPKINLSDSDKRVVNIFKYFVLVILIGMPVLYLFFQPFIKTQLQQFWGTIDMLQLYFLLQLSDIRLFDNVYGVLHYTGYSSLFFKELRDDFSFSKNYELSKNDLLPIFAELGIDSNFIFNAFFPLLLLLTAMVLFLLSRCMCSTSTEGAGLAFYKFVNFGCPLRVHLFIISQLALACFLQFVNFEQIGNCVASIIFFLWILAFFVFMWYLLNHTNMPFEYEQYIQEFGVLYEGLEFKSMLKRNFHLIFLFRKVFIAMMVAFVDNKGLSQMCWIGITQIVFFCALATKLPYKDKLNNYLFVASELCLYIFLVMMICWSFFDFIGEGLVEADRFKSMSWVMVSFFVIGLLIRVIGFFLEFSKNRIFEIKVNKPKSPWEDKEKRETAENPDDFKQIELTNFQELKQSQKEQEQMSEDDSQDRDSQSFSDNNTQ